MKDDGADDVNKDFTFEDSDKDSVGGIWLSKGNNRWIEWQDQ